MATNDRLRVYLGTAEVAELFHVSTETVLRWTRERRLPYIRALGGRRLYPGDAIRRLAAGLPYGSEAPELAAL